VKPRILVGDALATLRTLADWLLNEAQKAVAEMLAATGTTTASLRSAYDHIASARADLDADTK